MRKNIERIIVIGLDGVGAFLKDAKTPNIHALLQDGVLTYSAQTAFPSISAQCWGTLLHSVSPDKHGRDNDIAGQHKFPEDSPYPSFLKTIKQSFPNGKIAAFSCWSPINFGIIEDSTEATKVSLPDPELADAAVQYIRANPDFKAMFFQFDHPDGAGHKYGYGSKEFLDIVAETDIHIGKIIDVIKEQNLLDDTLIIITTDHGGGGDDGYYSHGSAHPLDMTIFWGCYGPGVAKGAALEGVHIADTAAVALHALGLEVPAHYEGKVPAGLFSGAEVTKG